MKTNYVSIQVFLLVIIIIVSCKNISPDNQENKELKSGILIENMDTLVNPGDNFMKYVNGTWIKNTEIPADKSSVSLFSNLVDETEENVKKIIEESASGEFPNGSDEQKIGDLYNSFMDIEKRNSIGVSPLKSEFSRIDEINNYDELASYFAYANKNGFTVPLALFILPDFKDPTKYSVFSWQSGLGLPDREYYLKNDERSKEIQTKYTAHIEKMYGLAELPDGEEAAKLIMALETKIAEKHMVKERVYDFVDNYNMLPIDTLSNIAPQFNWIGFLKEAGLEKEEKLGILMIDYTMALDNIITSTELATWKTYLKWSVINANSTRLSEAIDKQNFNFYSKELRGTEEQKPLWRRGVKAVNSTLGEVVGKVYVKKHFKPEVKKRMNTLVANLLKAYQVSIIDLDWMSDETKKEALIKLSKFNAKIGYPDKWKTYDLEIKADDLYGNLKRSSLLEYNRELGKLGQAIDKEEWGVTPQTVNAFYDPFLNAITFPAAILQAPFFDMNAEDAVNYGTIGAVIGHEIGHGFDKSGSTFDGDGLMRNWWTDKDREEFTKRTKNLIAQYNVFEVLPGLYVNGEFTLDENIGDLGGLSIALKAYQISLGEEESPELDGFTGEQRFFIGWAQFWCEKKRTEELRVMVNTDRHSPPEFRANGIVRNIPEFYSAFKVQESDSLYLVPENRVKIW